MKSYLHSLIYFLPFLLNHLQLPSQETPSILILPALDTHYIDMGQIQQKTLFPNNYSTVIEACLPHCCMEMAVRLLLRVSISAGTCLLSHCLAMNVYPSSTILAFRHHVTI
jgi:hypothetical protein